MIINVSRESVSNGDDYGRCATLEYQEGEMLSTFLRSKVSVFLPCTSGLTVWTIYMDSEESQETSEREASEKKVAFIHKIENRCAKVEIKGGDRAVSSFGADKMYCAVYR